MLHAVYFKKNENGDWNVTYNNRYVESETFKIEKQRGKPSFIPALEGDSPAILAAYVLNGLRFGTVNKDLNNTNIFEHSGKLYTISENHVPQEIDMFTLNAMQTWDVNGAWDRPFTSHPKRASGTGELIIMGTSAMKPYYVLGVISADGKNLRHKVDLKFERCVLSHDIGITEKYNVIIDYPLIIDIKRVFKGGPLLKYYKDGQARFGVMPRYGDADSVQWFKVESHCTFHLFNTFEEGDEVVVRGCRALSSILPGPEMGENTFEWFSRGFNFKPTKTSLEENNAADNGSTEEGFLFTCVYEWRLNMVTGEVRERNLSGTYFSMDFPVVNADFIGLKHKYGYTQVVDSEASSSCGLAKYGGLAKIYFDEPWATQTVEEGEPEQLVKVEHHKFPENSFCSGIVFVRKNEGVEEDDGWIVSYVHDEQTDESQVYIVDAKHFGSKPVAKITLPRRVPYGFHGTYISTRNQALA
ncbi:Carotenoid 9,10(9',10')-cleavage dioxygenase [Actinidia chinensis var. chinensis]|uniref:Carotenoid 9,10(9',10')-cleavage dioxygenase n=1 Tax=Actinidia chinensis var. chinensis TaxID=1590841 RepID=A0A2R6PHL2_ACTCC|nr:Carotenoid 9,10(9',10')-cleavage dioxygenase [Actinidia chinensis var. chinensis]